jgi:hypothetical protein
LSALVVGAFESFEAVDFDGSVVPSASSVSSSTLDGAGCAEQAAVARRRERPNHAKFRVLIVVHLSRAFARVSAVAA